MRRELLRVADDAGMSPPQLLCLPTPEDIEAVIRRVAGERRAARVPPPLPGAPQSGGVVACGRAPPAQAHAATATAATPGAAPVPAATAGCGDACGSACGSGSLLSSSGGDASGGAPPAAGASAGGAGTSLWQKLVVPVVATAVAVLAVVVARRSFGRRYT